MIEYKYPCSPVSLSKSVGILGICIYQDTPFISWEVILVESLNCDWYQCNNSFTKPSAL